MKKNIFIIAAILFSTVSNVSADTFVSDLKNGMSSDEVLMLQKILNTDSDTLVSSDGPGSSGNETNYFGLKTENAVKRFQEKYRNEILTPLGLSLPTGIVGSRTRQVLNNLSQGVSVTDSSFNVPNNTSLSGEYDYTKFFPTISGVYPSVVENPMTEPVTIYGTNFTKSNKVFLSIQGLEIFSASSVDGQTLSVLLSTQYSNLIQNTLNSIPENAEGTARKNALDLLKAEFNSTDKNGIYVPAVLFVQNENGESNKYNISINLFKDEE